jgi:anti-sigma regulatory factor (Ser/Thr protein kinase)
MGLITRTNNCIKIEGRYEDGNLHYLLGTIHKSVVELGYTELTLDFSRCQAAFPSTMLATCAQVMNKRKEGIVFELILPELTNLKRLFNNANWSFLIDPNHHNKSRFQGYTQVPTIQYRDPEEQHDAVNSIVTAILSAVPGLERSSFAAFEWAINEITDNVLTHADSSIGGLVQVSTFMKNRKRVQFLVADAGKTIPATLKGTQEGINSDIDALDKAIREGVTRDKNIGQGNGLFGTFQICSHCKGDFKVESGRARLTYSERGGLHIKGEKVPYDGTLVIASIDFSKPSLLEEALKFGGETYSPVDYIETKYKGEFNENINFLMKEEAKSFGTRPAGTPVRTRLYNLFKMNQGNKIIIDFDGIPIVSSSFADEVFGKLFVEIGPVGFMQSFEFLNTSPTVRKLIDKAISQRVASSSP